MFSWSFSNKKSRTSKWYITAIICVLVFLIYGIISGVYMMSIAILLFAWVFLLIENNSVPMTNVIIDQNWIHLNQEFYEWNNFDSFGIFYVWNLQIVRLISKNKIANVFDIPLSPEIDKIELANFLSNFVTENKNMKANNLDNLARIIKI